MDTSGRYSYSPYSSPSKDMGSNKNSNSPNSSQSQQRNRDGSFGGANFSYHYRDNPDGFSSRDAQSDDEDNSPIWRGNTDTNIQDFEHNKGRSIYFL